MPRPTPKELQALGTAGVLTTFFLAACGAGQAAAPAAAPTPAPNVPAVAPSSSARPPSAQKFTDQNWGIVLSDPGKYTGAAVDLDGTVFNVEQDATRVGIQMWTDPLRGQGNTVVIFPRQGFPEIHKDDQVEVRGSLVGEFAGKNDSGKALKLPKIEATSVTVKKAAPSAASSATASVRAATLAGSPSASASASTEPSASANPSASASGKALAAGVYRVQGSEPTGLAIRTGPGIGQHKVGVVHDGGLLFVIAPAAPGWAEIRGDGFSGYVSTSYLGATANAAGTSLARLGK